MYIIDLISHYQPKEKQYKLNLSIADTFGTAKRVLNSEVSLQKYFVTQYYLYVARALLVQCLD